MENTMANVEPTVSERFIGKVINECKATSSGQFEVTDSQRKVIQEYFHGIDATLAAAETKRQAQIAAGNIGQLGISGEYPDKYGTAAGDRPGSYLSGRDGKG